MYLVPSTQKKKKAKTNAEEQRNTWRDHRHARQHRNSRSTRYNHTRQQCAGKDGGAGGSVAAAEARGDGAGLRGPASPPAGASAMEEESQVVTYGEQYNPATGWLR